MDTVAYLLGRINKLASFIRRRKPCSKMEYAAVAIHTEEYEKLRIIRD